MQTVIRKMTSMTHVEEVCKVGAAGLLLLWGLLQHAAAERPRKAAAKLLLCAATASAPAAIHGRAWEAQLRQAHLLLLRRRRAPLLHGLLLPQLHSTIAFLGAGPIVMDARELLVAHVFNRVALQVQSTPITRDIRVSGSRHLLLELLLLKLLLQLLLLELLLLLLQALLLLLLLLRCLVLLLLLLQLLLVTQLLLHLVGRLQEGGGRAALLPVAAARLLLQRQRRRAASPGGALLLLLLLEQPEQVVGALVQNTLLNVKDLLLTS